jgi:hypothetical protein
MSSRFEMQYEFVLKIVETFVEKVGKALDGTKLSELLKLVSELKIQKTNYTTWNESLGCFLQVMGPEAFFKVLPLHLMDHDMNSLRYAQDSRSYLILVIGKYLKKGDLVFFMSYLLP